MPSRHHKKPLQSSLLAAAALVALGGIAWDLRVAANEPRSTTVATELGTAGDFPDARAAALLNASLLATTTLLVSFSLGAGASPLRSSSSPGEASELERQRRRAERLATVGALAAGLAHEIRNPLNAISLAAQRIERLPQLEPEPRAMVRQIRGEAQRLDATLTSFLELGHPLSGKRQVVDLAAVAGEVVALLEPEATARGVELTTRLDPLNALADRAAIYRALVNLLRNAIEASPGGESVELELVRSGRRGAPSARFAVRDRGHGLDPALGERVFDAFVSSKTNGTGLGLALVQRIATDHGGAIQLANRPGGGAEAILHLPASEAAA